MPDKIDNATITRLTHHITMFSQLTKQVARRHQGIRFHHRTLTPPFLTSSDKTTLPPTRPRSPTGLISPAIHNPTTDDLQKTTHPISQIEILRLKNRIGSLEELMVETRSELKRLLLHPPNQDNIDIPFESEVAPGIIHSNQVRYSDSKLN